MIQPSRKEEKNDKHRYHTHLYVGGTSVTKGGGFENNRTDIRPLYKEKYNIDLPDIEFCSYASVLASNLGVSGLTNDAKCGSGTKRIIRKATEFIVNTEYDNRVDLDKHYTYHFEFQPGIRDDVWFSKENEYGICNASWNDRDKRYQFSLVKEWFTEEETNQRYDETYGEDYQKYIDNHFDEVEYHKNESRMIMNFIGWLDSLPLRKYYTFSIGHFDNCYYITEEGERKDMREHPRCINRYLDGKDLWNYAHDMKWLISDEVDNDDNHIGYFGSRKIGNKLTSIFAELTKVGPLFGDYKIQPKTEIEFCSPFEDYCPAIADVVPHLKNINFKQVPADNCKLLCIEHDNLHQGTEFYEFKHYYEDIQKIVKNNGGKMFLSIRQESFQDIVEESIYKVCCDEWGWDKSDIIILDCNINRADLSLLIKTYQDDPIVIPESPVPLSAYFHDAWTLKQPQPRRFNFSMLINKETSFRIGALDKLFKHGIPSDSLFTLRAIPQDFEDIQSLSNYELENIDNIKLIRGKSVEDYYPLGESEKFDEYLRTNQTIYNSVIKTYKDSHFNIILETSMMAHESKKDIFNHVSEKTLIPILCGCLVFAVVPGINYQIMEDKWGLNFSYLKEFGITDYRTNTLEEQMSELSKIGKWANENGGDFLFRLHKKYHDIITDNYRVLENALFTDKTEETLIQILNYHKEYSTQERPKQKFYANEEV